MACLTGIDIGLHPRKYRRRARKIAKNQIQDKFLMDNYTQKLAIIQTKVSEKKGELEKDIKDWENNYFISNNNLPTYDNLVANSVMKDKVNISLSCILLACI
jgi:hypothetical protein